VTHRRALSVGKRAGFMTTITTACVPENPAPISFGATPVLTQMKPNSRRLSRYLVCELPQDPRQTTSSSTGFHLGSAFGLRTDAAGRPERRAE
jgi:hypothetical protein